MGLRRFLLIVSIVMVIMLITAIWFFPSNEDFRVENPFWNGTGEISTDYAVQPLKTLADLPASPEGATFILIPYLRCTPAELGQLKRFVRNGGRLILADDYGYGNQVLESLGLEIRFSGEMLLDPMVNYKSKHFPRIVHLEPDPLTGNIENLSFNHATCLINVTTASTLASSSSFSFLDRNGNGIREDNEPTGPLPVIARHRLGSGQVIFIADPSLFINSMDPIESNHALVQNIAATTTSRLLIDQSHLPPSNLDRTKSLLAAIRSFLSNPAGALGVLVVVLTLVLMPVWLKKERNKESLKGGDIDYTE